MPLDAPLAARLAFTAGLMRGGTGCQVLFPLPLDTEAHAREPSRAVRVVGPSYAEGESLEADVLIDGVLAGRGRIATGRRCLVDGKPALPVSSQASTAGIAAVFGNASEDARGLLDLDTNAPMEGAWTMAVGELRTFVELAYAGSGYRLHQRREEAGKPERHIHRRVKLPTEQPPHDAHSLLGYLRRWDAPEGTRGHLYVNVGRTLFRVDAVVVGAETIPTATGPIAARRIDGVATRTSDKTLKPGPGAPRAFSLWVADDEERVPHRVLFESNGVTLTLELTRRTIEPASAEGRLAPCARVVDAAELAKADAPPKRTPKPEPAKSKGAAPKPVKPGTAKPDASRPGPANADAAKPEAAKPDADPDDDDELASKLKLRVLPRLVPVPRPGPTPR
jgi:hypothetical protein